MTDPHQPDADRGRPLVELRTSGLLWLINRVVFHPRGWALALHHDQAGQVTGWSLQGDGTEVWRFDGNEDDLFEAAQRTLTVPALDVPARPLVSESEVSDS